MKTMKKVLALLVAVLMIAASVAAFAAETPAYDTSVSVTALTDGDVAHFYQIVEWVGTAEGNIKGWKVKAPFDFNLEKVLLGDKATQAQIDADEADADGYVKNTATGFTAELANTLAGQAQAAVTAKTVTSHDETATSGAATYANVPNAGIYMALITPTSADVVYNPVFVSSDFNKDEQGNTNTWAVDESASYTNSAAAKKSTTTLTKEANTDEVKPDDVKWITTAIGDTVHFTVTTTIPGFGPAFKNPFFKMTDKLTDLTLVAKSVKVKSPAEAAAAAHIVEGTDQYTIDWNEAAGKAYLATVKTPTLVTVEYDAIVATTAPKNINWEKNEVWTEFSHDINNEDDHSFKKDTTQHYTFTIDANVIAGKESEQGVRGSEIVKVGVDANGNPINNTTEYSSITKTNSWSGPQAEAHFKLYRAADCAPESEYIPNGASAGLDITSGTDGRMTITGLDAGEYWLKEVSCPAGFVMDTHIAHIVISTNETQKDVTEYTTDGETWITADAYGKLDTEAQKQYKSYTYKTYTLDDYTITIDDAVASHYTFENKGNEIETKWTDEGIKELPHQFKNTKGLQLPSTGGMGTTLLYVGGSILVLAAVILLVTKRRMGSDE